MILSNYLSLWEIAHRWHNADPNKTDPENLPFEIQDTLRYLSRLVLAGKLYLHEQLFISIKNDHGNVKNQSHLIGCGEIPPAYEECVTERKYTKKVLDIYLIDRVDLFRFSVINDEPFPDFWWDASIVVTVGGHYTENSDPASKTQILAAARISIIDKSICQAVAKTLWEIYPDMNITRMTKHPSILKYGGGSNYPGKNTLRDWLREVAPEHLKNKPGRPKTTKPNNDEA